MPLALYVFLWGLAAMASLAGLAAVWIPAVVIGGVLVIRAELLALLGLLVRPHPVRKLDRSVVPNADPA